MLRHTGPSGGGLIEVLGSNEVTAEGAVESVWWTEASVWWAVADADAGVVFG